MLPCDKASFSKAKRQKSGPYKIHLSFLKDIQTLFGSKGFLRANRFECKNLGPCSPNYKFINPLKNHDSNDVF